MKKRILSIVLAVVMIATMIPLGAVSALAESKGTYTKRSWNGEKVTESEEDIPADVKVITPDTAELYNGWYAVTQNTNLPDETPLLIKGDNVNIVLFDGCTLYSTSEIIIEDGAVLNVYGQAVGSGFIDTAGNENGIQNNGTLNVCGGNVIAYGDYNMGAGIGGNGDVYIYGGSVDAQGNGNRAGIYADNVYVYGGSVKARGYGNGAGISATGVYVYGGKTEAYGNSGGAGIGGSDGQDGGDFYFYGGVVEAYSSGYGGVGIGAGDGGKTHGAFWVDNEVVTTILASNDMNENKIVTADEYNRERYRNVRVSFCREHIDKDGNNWCDNCSAFFVEHYTVLKSDTTTLTGNILVESMLAFNTPLVVSGDVTLYLATNAQIAAYNGIVLNAGNSLTINAQVSDLCFVSAMGEYGAAGIGGEYGKSAGKLTVNGGIIRAYGGYGVKGIGGGMHGKDGDFIQNGGEVYSYNGGGLEHEHTFEEDYTFDENHHWKNCTCGHTVADNFGTHDYDITKEGYLTKYICKVCGYTKYEQDPDTCTVTFDMQGYGGEVPSQIVKKNGYVTRPTPDPSYENRIFGGWYEDILCIHEWDFDNYVVSDDTTLYAKWIPTSCTVYLYLGDADGTRIQRHHLAHYGQDLPDIEPPTRDGLVFLGYYLVGEIGTPPVQYYNAYGKGVCEWDIETSTASLVAFWASSGSGGHTHTYSDEWSMSETHHWHDCTCEGEECKGFVSGFGEHNFDKGVKSGIVTVYTCRDCGYKKTVLSCDVNGDGKIDANDLALLKIALLGGCDYYGVLDFNGDDKIDILDMVRLKKHLSDETVPLGKQESKPQAQQPAPELAIINDKKF